jgi:hypothetical protein
MAQDMEAIQVLFYQFQEFAMLIQPVHVEVNVISTPTLSRIYPPSRDCICGRPRQHFPNYDFRHENVGLHDR